LTLPSAWYEEFRCVFHVVNGNIAYGEGGNLRPDQREHRAYRQPALEAPFKSDRREIGKLECRILGEEVHGSIK
jgi:hypothetical protein